jgi:shikimate kinase
MNIILIGFMGSGKSTVGHALSDLLGYMHIEMDDLACQRTNHRTMNELFNYGGEFLLRETEIAIAKEYAAKPNLVISTGGGVVLNKIILDYFKREGGKVIFLHGSFDLLAQRASRESRRPLFRDLEEAKKIYDFRLPLYLHYSDVIIDIDQLSVDGIASKIQASCTDGG